MGVACLAAFAPELLPRIICPVWTSFSPYWHLAMLIFPFSALATDAAYDDDAHPFMLICIWPVLYFPLMRWYILFVEYVPVPNFVFGFHILQLPIILLPALFLSIIIGGVSDRFTGKINQ